MKVAGGHNKLHVFRIRGNSLSKTNPSMKIPNVYFREYVPISLFSLSQSLLLNLFLPPFGAGFEKVFLLSLLSHPHFRRCYSF